MNSDTPKYKSQAEYWRTLAALLQLMVGVATLVILICVHFL